MHHHTVWQPGNNHNQLSDFLSWLIQTLRVCSQTAEYFHPLAPPPLPLFRVEDCLDLHRAVAASWAEPAAGYIRRNVCVRVCVHVHQGSHLFPSGLFFSPLFPSCPSSSLPPAVNKDEAIPTIARFLLQEADDQEESYISKVLDPT